MRDRASEFAYRPGRDGASKAMGDLEGRVMEAVWKLGSATVTEVQANLAGATAKLAYNTVKTVLARLHEKGYLRRRKEGRAFRYLPSRSREEFLAEVSRNVFSGLAEDLSGSVAAAFVDGLAPHEVEALEELARVIEERRRKREGGTS